MDINNAITKLWIPPAHFFDGPLDVKAIIANAAVAKFDGVIENMLDGKILNHLNTRQNFKYHNDAERDLEECYKRLLITAISKLTRELDT